MTIEWLTRALEESRARGFLGPGEIAPHIEHSRGFRAAWDEYRSAPPASLIDLGSGGGIPGVVLAEEWGCPTVLLDSMAKRCRSLEEYLEYPNAPKNISVRCGRAEELARESDLDGRFELLVMRSFGAPSAAAECAVRYVSVGGLIIVSEPPDPDSQSRWNRPGLEQLGLRIAGFAATTHHFVVIEKIAPTPPPYPRDNGIPGKRPIWS